MRKRVTGGQFQHGGQIIQGVLTDQKLVFWGIFWGTVENTLKPKYATKTMR